MKDEILLTGGRVTQGVVRIGDRVHRPQCANAGFIHNVLNHLEQKNIPFAPRFHGVDEKGREILTFMVGSVPDNLGDYASEQCAAAARIIRALHEALADFPGCPAGTTVCHFDLSPCNFTFIGDLPAAVIDWNAAAFGEPLDDLAYAAWMWLDIGNDENDPAKVFEGITAMLDAYGTTDRASFCTRIHRQMARVGASVFPTEEQTLATRRWTEDCRRWLENFMEKYPEL